jgi:hypothetical protein
VDYKEFVSFLTQDISPVDFNAFQNLDIKSIKLQTVHLISNIIALSLLQRDCLVVLVANLLEDILYPSAWIFPNGYATRQCSDNNTGDCRNSKHLAVSCNDRLTSLVLVGQNDQVIATPRFFVL